jgi:phosphatidylglycerol---prolipoprotein diacylglyceryl transferase
MEDIMYPFIYFGDLQISSYNILAGLGVTAGFIIIAAELRSMKAEKKFRYYVFAASLVITMYLGARAGNEIESLFSKGYSPDFSVFGTTSLLPGLILGFMCSFIAARLLKLNAWEALDIVSMPSALGGFLIRIGCFLRGCCFGIPVPDSCGIGVHYPFGSYAFNFYPDTALLPVQVFEALVWLSLFIVIYARKKRPHFKGELAITTAFLYSISRFILEFYRFHETKPGVLSYAQILCLIILFISILTWFVRNKSEKPHIKS